MSDVPTYILNDGTTIPAVGFGTWPMKGSEATRAVLSALEAGYRLIDTAVNYDNEREVGEAIRTSGVARDEIRVTSKIPGRHHAYDDAIRSTHKSLERLGLDRLDLHLIHWPNPSDGLFPETWSALVDLQKEGLVTTIGVSNFTQTHLQRIIDESGVTPAVNQVELHPLFPQQQMREANERLGVRTESWSPLGKRQAPFDEPAVRRPAEKYGVSPGQVILRWQVQLGAVPIPKSRTPERQRQNLDVFGFELEGDEVAAITALGRPDGRLFGGDPDRHEEQ